MGLTTNISIDAALTGVILMSPGWSIHAGVGTKSYGLCWGMGGENQRYDDMDALAIAELK